MTNSILNTPEPQREITEAYRNAAKTVSQELGLTFIQETPAANPTNTENNTVSLEEQKHTHLKSVMREEMLAQGISPGAIKEAEKFADLRREFVQESLKIKGEPVSQPVILGISADESDKFYKQAEDTITDMLLIRKQSQQPSNNKISTKKPD